jgi:hypothetical protein
MDRARYSLCRIRLLAETYDIIDRVRKIALEHNCAAVIVMHTKKGSPGGNPIENLLGTSGIPAAADAVAELKRFKSGPSKLTIVGRSVPAEEYELIWHGGPEEWGWTIEGQGDQVVAGDTSEEVLAYLDAQGATKPSSIAAALRKPFGAVWQALLRLQEKGKVNGCQFKRETAKRETAGTRAPIQEGAIRQSGRSAIRQP